MDESESKYKVLQKYKEKFLDTLNKSLLKQKFKFGYTDHVRRLCNQETLSACKVPSTTLTLLGPCTYSFESYIC